MTSNLLTDTFHTPTGLSLIAWQYSRLSDKRKSNKKIFIKAIKSDFKVMGTAPPSIKDDKNMIKYAIKICSTAFYHASDRLKNNFNFVKTVSVDKPWIIQYASYRLKDSDLLMSHILKKSGTCLRFASKRIINNELLVLLAMRNNYHSLKYASESLKDNDKFVLNAITIHGNALQYASDRIQNNEKYALLSLKHSNHESWVNIKSQIKDKYLYLADVYNISLTNLINQLIDEQKIYKFNCKVDIHFFYQ